MAMIKKDVSYKMLRSFVSRVNSTTASPARRTTINTPIQNSFPAVAQPVATVKDDGNDGAVKIFDFEDTKRLFASVPTRKLLHSAITLNVCAMESMVDFSIKVMNSKTMETNRFFREAVLKTIRHSAYDHFVAGEDTVQAGRTVNRLWESGLRGMLDYGLEHAADNESCDDNTQELIKTAESAHSLPPSSVSFVVVKVTAICPVYLLRRVSDLLRWEYQNSSFKLSWKQQTLPIFSESSPFYHTLQQPAPLSAEEEHDLELAHQRLTSICDKSINGGIPVVVDAEDTSIQPAIDYLTYWAALNYNKGTKPMVFGTIQGYLKDAGKRMYLTKKAADKMGVPVGFKLVRGAYMSSERKLANSLGVDSPVHDTLNGTHDCFNGCASFMLDEVSKGPGGLVLASHNLESGKLAAQKARDYGIGKESEKLEFASLYGMAEGMTFGLKNGGFSVSKYLPFGPVEQIMPYLLRRAEENRGLLSSSNLDRQLMKQELKRRLKACFTVGENQFKPETNSMASN
ncbi:proline dehydrogenase 2, mitochondrial-like [Cynara cardunculus var. scolymus]|uniref:Proline dehydrogenase n=1 Tax=Cynara cardunculus var. scolymus TaxID=59895 RepID=A0A103XKV4_CYNCS|nr:proline dehydrogenase 2, mitochondrial-like [Cynara cardunculus var. scolymus]KVH92598.1 Proline dehydrogenase [Cynara cardunculus var. scolymus]